ncbi:MAG: lmo0937 family membrane protein [Clostridia bacterium]
MLWTIAVVLVVLWLLGFITVGGGLIHTLLVIALIIIILQLVRGRK